MHRCFTPDLDPSAGDYHLQGSEARHLTTVLRAQRGDAVQLFDGRGGRADAVVIEATKADCWLRIESRGHTPAAENPFRIAVAFPKGDRADWLVEKATELGIARLIPIRTERSVVHPGAGKLEKLRRAVVESCKQCGRDWLMQIDDEERWSDFASTQSGKQESWLLDPSGEVLTIGNVHAPNLVAIGPEGGWSQNEIDAARSSGWKVVRLPGNVLRIETAVAAIAAWRLLIQPLAQRLEAAPQ